MVGQKYLLLPHELRRCHTLQIFLSHLDHGNANSGSFFIIYMYILRGDEIVGTIQERSKEEVLFPTDLQLCTVS